MKWGDPQTWKERNFISLSKQIQDVSSIYISPHTLKRLFNKIKTSEHYLPQPTTLEALAIFLGYDNWMSFEEAVRQNKVEIKKINTLSGKPVQSGRGIRLLKYFLFIVLVFALGYWIAHEIKLDIHPNCRIEIYNRWGQIVYKTHKYTDEHAWDGNFNGQPLPVDSYHFIIDTGSGRKPILGQVTILK